MDEEAFSAVYFLDFFGGDARLDVEDAVRVEDEGGHDALNLAVLCKSGVSCVHGEGLREGALTVLNMADSLASRRSMSLDMAVELRGERRNSSCAGGLVDGGETEGVG